MRKIRRLFFWMFTCGLVLLPTLARANSVNRIVELTGKAQIQRLGATNPQPAFLGMTLNLGDILLPAEGAVVRVRCSDRQLGKAQAGVMSGLKTICPGSKNTDARAAAPIFLELLEETFVYRTLVLTDKPLLSWPSVPGATSYRVQLKAGEQIIWSQTVEDTNVLYSGEPLRPKFFYQLVVEAVDGNSSSPYQLQLRRTERGFLIEEERKKIKLEPVSEEVQALLLADYYLEQQDELKSGFLLAASQSLEKLFQQGDLTPFVHRLLGDIYLRLGRLQESVMWICQGDNFNLAQSSSFLLEKIDRSPRSKDYFDSQSIRGRPGNRFPSLPFKTHHATFTAMRSSCLFSTLLSLSKPRYN